jgi:tetratricopeptide (TPR) repeat protein
MERLVKHLLNIFTCFLLMPVVIFSQDIALLQKEAEKLESTSQEDAFSKYQELLKISPTNINALCKSSELCSSIGHRKVKKEEKVSYFKAARKYAEIALRLNPNSPEANFAMSVSMGRMALISSGRQKIEAVNDIKKYAELAIKNDPRNFKAYHVLARWHYEVSNLNSIERAAARILYGGLPSASLSTAIQYYEKSKSLNPTFILNYLELAKAYHRNKQGDKALVELATLQNISNSTSDDQRAKDEAKKLQQEWKK